MSVLLDQYGVSYRPELVPFFLFIVLEMLSSLKSKKMSTGQQTTARKKA
jgi:hypothetical protein